MQDLMLGLQYGVRLQIIGCAGFQHHLFSGVAGMLQLTAMTSEAYGCLLSMITFAMVLVYKPTGFATAAGSGSSPCCLSFSGAILAMYAD